jgi:DNA-binding NarL/FixJ family response regulator
MINVLVAEDHPIVRDVLSRLLEKESDLEVVAMVRNGEKAVNAAIRHHPHVAVLDIRMSDMDGIEATQEILAQSPQTRVLMLSGFNDAEYIRKSLEAGAVGYVLKDFVKKDLALAIHAVYKGHYYFSEQIAEVAKLYMTGDGVDEGSA